VTDDLAVYEAIAVAVAEGHEPDLSPFDPSDVRTSMQRVLGFAVPRYNFLAWLNSRVQVLSGGRVSVQEGPPGDGQDADRDLTGLPPDPGDAPILKVRLLVEGEPFAEPAVLRADGGPVLRFPMRG
jgi:hypothetical protein